MSNLSPLEFLSRMTGKYSGWKLLDYPNLFNNPRVFKRNLAINGFYYFSAQVSA